MILRAALGITARVLVSAEPPDLVHLSESKVTRERVVPMAVPPELAGAT